MTNQRTAVISTMKNEGPFILEWVAHYRALGFDHIVVCTNDCTDPTVEILLRLQEMGFVFHHNTIPRQGGLQRSAIRQGIKINEEVNKNVEWYFVCDADEFLNIHMGDGSIQALIEGSGEDSDCICIPWRVFVPDGTEDFVDVPLTNQFTKGELPFDAEMRPQTGKFVKSIFRNIGKYRRLGLHVPLPKPDMNPKYVLPGGEIYMTDEFERTDAPPVFTNAQINHYALRSLDSFLVKRARGRANHVDHVLGVDYWDRFDIPAEEDRTISRYKPKRDEYLKMFLEDKRLKELHEKAVDWHLRKAISVKLDPENEMLLQRLRVRNRYNINA